MRVPFLKDAPRVLIQGITGKEGRRVCKEMIEYGTRVCAGVTPGKGRSVVHRVRVYDTVKAAKQAHPDINTSFVSVPPAYVKDAALEAIANGVVLIIVLTEHVPVQDSAHILAWARRYGAHVIGPSSIGVIVPGKEKIGSIGSNAMQSVFTPGPVGIVSKSGGMTAEIAAALSKEGIGQSTIIGIGGDMIIGTTFADLLPFYENDKKTRAIVCFGEAGGDVRRGISGNTSFRRFFKADYNASGRKIYTPS